MSQFEIELARVPMAQVLVAIPTEDLRAELDRRAQAADDASIVGYRNHVGVLPQVDMVPSRWSRFKAWWSEGWRVPLPAPPRSVMG